MDLYILLTVFGSFFVFLIIHVIIFRLIEERTVLAWLPRIYIVGAFFNIFISLILRLSPVFALFSLVLYTMLVFCYILGIFGLMESSIRIGLLTKIAQNDYHGIKRKDILRVYNSKIVVTKRLERFVSSGELKYEKGYYSRNKKFSYFVINDLINNLMRKIYN